MTVLHEFVGSRTGDSRNFPDGLFPIFLIQVRTETSTAPPSSLQTIPRATFTGQGTIFSITPTGSFSTLHNFALDGSDGVQPSAHSRRELTAVSTGANKAYGYPGTPDASILTTLPANFTTNGNIYKISSTGKLSGALHLHRPG